MNQTKVNTSTKLRVGIDVGSTTTKIVVIGEDNQKLLLSDYNRHHSDQLQSVKRALMLFDEKFPNETFYAAITGSGAKSLAEE